MPWLYWPVSIYCPISLLILVASESIWYENRPLSALQRCCSLYICWSSQFSLHAAPEHVLVGIMTYHTMVFRSSVYVAYAAIQDVDGLKDAVTKLMTLVQRHAGDARRCWYSFPSQCRIYLFLSPHVVCGVCFRAFRMHNSFIIIIIIIIIHHHPHHHPHPHPAIHPQRNMYISI